MEFFLVLWHRVQSLATRRRHDAELDEELRAHIALATEEHQRRGMSADEARRQALVDFGGLAQARENYRVQRSFHWLEELVRDLRYAARQLMRNRGFSATVILTLALAIGVNTAAFSLVNALLLRHLPYPQPERLGTISTRITGPMAMDAPDNINGEQWENLRDRVPSLTSAVASNAIDVNLATGKRAQAVRSGRVSAHYFDVLGIHPVMGRNFTEEEDRPNGAKVALLSDRLWRSVFNSDRTLVGQAIRLKGETYTVIGILPENTQTPMESDVYTPLRPSREGEGKGGNYEAIVRLRDGATWQQADAEIGRAWADVGQRFAARNPGTQVSFHTVALQKGAAGQLRPLVLGLLLATGFILLIACANLAGLMLVRMERRKPELATRLALGASMSRVLRQLWVESLLLALLGGVAGVSVGYAALHGLLVLLPKHFLPVANVPLDGHVLAFTLIASLLTSLLFGMLPALFLRSFDLRERLSNRACTSHPRLRLRQMLIAGEVALTVVLLAASGLLIHTLVHLETLPPGFDAKGVLAAKASLDDARYADPAAFRKLMDESVTAMQRIPGVKNAAVGLTLPYERPLNDQITVRNGKEAGTSAGSDEIYTTPGYFETLGIPLLAGRAFASSDGPEAQHVAIVNLAFARKFFHGGNPVGRAVGKDTMIVGMVGDVPLSPCFGNDDTPLDREPTMYTPAAQAEKKMLTLVHGWFEPNWIVRATNPNQNLAIAMQRTLASVDPALPFSGFYHMNDLRAKTLYVQRVEVAALGVLAGLALLLSAVGIFALVASLVALRAREIGIRIALGASLRQAITTIGSCGIYAALAGLGIGIALCAALLPAMRSVIFGIEVYDMRTAAAVVASLLLVVLLAAFTPALRIARIDPAQTLRAE
jgi:predicted permease